MALLDQPDVVALVLEEDSELASQLSVHELKQARTACRARVLEVPKGPWDLEASTRPSGMLGYLVLTGHVAGRISVQDHSNLEVLGKGDILRPWVELNPNATVRSVLNWQVIAPIRLAVLDQKFALASAHWPDLTAALMNRLVVRSRRLAFQLAVNSFPRTIDRILLMLWTFADRWGHITPQGAVVRLPLTHESLAEVVGVQRPSLTTALGELRQQGRLQTLTRGTWLLSFPAPAHLAVLREQVGLSAEATKDIQNVAR
jgi:CRP/FNR family transcriptional regulator, cyclic AMP receptor protein